MVAGVLDEGLEIVVVRKDLWEEPKGGNDEVEEIPRTAKGMELDEELKKIKTLLASASIGRASTTTFVGS